MFIRVGFKGAVIVKNVPCFGLFSDDVHIYFENNESFVYNVIEYADHSNGEVYYFLI